MSKECSRCKITKPLSDFSKDRKLPFGVKSACKICASGDFKRWRHTNLEQCRKQDRVNHYIRKYNLSEEEALNLVLNRVRICSICKNIKPLVVDHCHKTGLVRGFICSACNSVLGYSKDNIIILKEAIKYLEDFYGE